jgi:hypothetical protein
MPRKAMNSEAEEEWSCKQKAANHIINVIIIGWNNHNPKSYIMAMITSSTRIDSWVRGSSQPIPSLQNLTCNIWSWT